MSIDGRSKQDLKPLNPVLAVAHIGDLHLTDAKQRNFLDFMSIVVQIEIVPRS